MANFCMISCHADQVQRDACTLNYARPQCQQLSHNLKRLELHRNEHQATRSTLPE